MIPGQPRAIYKFGKHTIDIMNALKYSAGRTTRSIADATFIKVRVTAVVLQRMKRYNVIERIENFGWRITSYGIEVLKILFSSVNNNNVNSKIIDNKHEDNSNSKSNEELPKIIPFCFSKSYCTIKRFWKDKRFTKRAEVDACGLCVCRDRKNWDTTESRNSLEVKGGVVIATIPTL